MPAHGKITPLPPFPSCQPQLVLAASGSRKGLCPPASCLLVEEALSSGLAEASVTPTCPRPFDSLQRPPPSLLGRAAKEGLPLGSALCHAVEGASGSQVAAALESPSFPKGGAFRPTWEAL